MSSTPPPSPPGRRRAFGLGALVVVAAGVGGAVWYAGHRPGADREEGLRLAGVGDFAAAEPLLARAQQRTPADPAVAEALARGYAAADDPKADAALTRWVELAPGRPDPLQARKAYYHKHKNPRAFPDARALSDLDPADAKARLTAAAYGFTYGYFAESEALCREGLARRPGDVELLRVLAQVRRARGDSAGAAAILDDILRDNPRLTGPLLTRAELYAAAGEPAKAVPLLRTVFDNDQNQRRAAGYQLAAALEQAGQADEAAKVRAEVRRLQDVEIARDAIGSRPDDPDLPVRLAEQLLADGHTADGLRFLSQVLARDPQFRPAHRVLADHYEKAGDAARAATHRRLAAP